MSSVFKTSPGTSPVFITISDDELETEPRTRQRLVRSPPRSNSAGEPIVISSSSEEEEITARHLPHKNTAGQHMEERMSSRSEPQHSSHHYSHHHHHSHHRCRGEHSVQHRKDQHRRHYKQDRGHYGRERSSHCDRLRDSGNNHSKAIVVSSEGSCDYYRIINPSLERRPLHNHTSHRHLPSPSSPPQYTNHKRQPVKSEQCYTDMCYQHDDDDITSCESDMTVKRQRLSLPCNIPPTRTTSDNRNRVIKQENTVVERMTSLSPHHIIHSSDNITTPSKKRRVSVYTETDSVNHVKDKSPTHNHDSAKTKSSPLKLTKKKSRMRYTEIDSVSSFNDVKKVSNGGTQSEVLNMAERSNTKVGIKREKLSNEAKKPSEMKKDAFATTNGFRDYKRRKTEEGSGNDEVWTSCCSTPEISPVHKSQRKKSRLSSASQNTHKTQRKIESYFNRDATPPLQLTTPTNVFTSAQIVSSQPYRMRTPTKSDHGDEEVFLKKTPSRESGTSSSSCTLTLSGEKKLPQPPPPHLQNDDRRQRPTSLPQTFTLSRIPNTPLLSIVTSMVSRTPSPSLSPCLSPFLSPSPSPHLSSESKTGESTSEISSKVIHEVTSKLSPSPKHTCTSENKTTKTASILPSMMTHETTSQLSPSSHHTCTPENKTNKTTSVISSMVTHETTSQLSSSSSSSDNRASEGVSIIPSEVMHATSTTTSNLLPSLSALSLQSTSQHRATYTIPSWSETALNTRGVPRSSCVADVDIPGLDVEEDDQDGCVALPATTSTCNYLAVYMQMTARHQRDDKKFVETLEEITVRCRCIPYDRITAVLRCVLKISDTTLLVRLYSMLATDASTRPTVISSTWPHELWEVMEECCRRFLPRPFTTSSPTPHSFNSAHVVLLYIVSLLAADMLRHCHTTTTTVPVLERILSITTRWQHVRIIIDLVFHLLVYQNDDHQLPLPDLLPVMTKLLCMCIWTSSVYDRNSVATRLARELSSRLSKLPSVDFKIHLLLLLPCHLLREKVISIHLQTEFLLLLPSDSLCGNILPSEEVTLDLIATTHLCRCPRHHDGTLHNLSFFLSLLFHLLLSHCSRLLGFSPLIPSQPSSSPDATLTPDELAQQLQPISHQIKLLSRRLSEDDDLLLELTSPNCWFYLQLLDSMFKWNHM